ncbi:MAG: hypothetical protein ABIH89_07045 [Elusimicrobiota bacterium]
MFSWLAGKPPLKKIGYSIFVYDITADYNAAALLGEIYRLYRQPDHAIRQYRRVLRLTDDKRMTEWAKKRLQEYEGKKREE